MREDGHERIQSLWSADVKSDVRVGPVFRTTKERLKLIMIPSQYGTAAVFHVVYIKI